MTMRKGEICYIGIGSNLGDRKAHLERAMECLLSLPEIQGVAFSSLYETEPVGPIHQPWFLNQVVALRTTLGPEALLMHCFQIEQDQGRVRTTPGGPRTLDLDILLYGNQIVRQEGLTIPHPRLAQRRFVLLPLTELAPRLIHPSLGKRMQTLLSELQDTHQVHRLMSNNHEKIHKTERLLKNRRSLQAAQKAPGARPQGPRIPQRTRKVREDLRGTENKADGLFQQPARSET